jgi:hypothetical protein
MKKFKISAINLYNLNEISFDVEAISPRCAIQEGEMYLRDTYPKLRFEIINVEEKN